MLERVSRVTFWSALAFTMVFALLPQPPQLPVEPTDKMQHIAAFVVLTTLARVGFRGVPSWLLAAAMIALGALIEVMQAVPVLRRSSDLHDWLADLVAVLFTLTAFLALRNLRPRLLP
jgi:VanZ family protein